MDKVPATFESNFLAFLKGCLIFTFPRTKSQEIQIKIFQLSLEAILCKVSTRACLLFFQLYTIVVKAIVRTIIMVINFERRISVIAVILGAILI